MTPQLTAEEAISQLRQQPQAYQTHEQLRALAAQVDANPAGRVTVLYSGPSAKGVGSSQIIKSMLEAGEDIRVIDISEAAKLLQSDDFLNSVAKAYGIDDFRSIANGTYRGPATEWLYHPTRGPWADASARFADATVGEVRTIVGDADPGRVFGATEVPRILANPNVTTIEGIPREALLARQASHGPQAAFEMVVANSREHVARLRVPVDTPVNYTGALLRDTYGELKLDSREYFAANQLEGKPPAFTTETRPLASNMHPPTQHALSGAAHVEAWQVERIQGAAMRAPAIGGRALHAAGAAGVALMAYDFVDTGHRVVQLRAQGNEVGADSAQAHFIGRNAAGALGGFLLGAGYGAATGSWTGPGAIATGVIGGIGGAYLGDRWAEQQDTARIYSQTDRSGNPWTRQPDDPQGIWSRTERTPTPTGGYQETRLVAGGRLHDELNYRAANDSYALGLANPPKPQAPFRLDASASTQSPRSPYETGRDYVRDAHSGQWQLEIRQNIEGRLPVTRHEPVSAEQANVLEQQSLAIIAQNAANTPAAVAARHQIAFEQFKWGDFTAHEPISPAIIHARTQTQTLQASDGNTYTRNPDGEWSRPGLLYGSHQAQGNLREELSRTWESQQTGLQEMAAMAEVARANPTPTASDLRGQVAGAYARAGQEPSDARIDAATAAVTQRHAQDGINGTQNTYFLQVQAGGAIATISGQNDKRMEILSLTTAEEIEQAQTRRPPTPEMRQRQAPQPAATPSPSPIQPQPPAPSQPHSHGGRSHSASGVTGHADEPQRAVAQSHSGYTGDFAAQEHAALAQQQIIDQHARLAAERAATQREEEEREQRHAPHPAMAHPQTGQTNPWDDTVAGRYINRYMDAAERGNEAEMLKLSEAYAETPKFKEWEAWGEDKLQQLAVEQQQQQQQQMQQEQHARVLSR